MRLNHVINAALLGAAMIWSGVALAELNDPPYWELYSPQGDSTSVSLCGTDSCTSDPNAFADNQMIVSVILQQPAGSGVRDTFLRQAQNESPGTPGSATTESAYNTDGYLGDATYLQDDSGTGINGDYVNQAKDSTAGNKDDFNNDILLTDLQVVNGYYQILLDVNEPGAGKQYIKLDEFEVHLSLDGMLGEYDPLTAGINNLETNDALGTFNDAQTTVKIFDMDFDLLGGLILTSVNEPTGRNGSGDEDYLFEIPEALFSAYLGEDKPDYYFHLVASFGETSETCCYNDNPEAYAEANFEEWTAITGPSGVPAPGTALLVSLGLLGLARFNRKPYRRC